MSNRLSVVAATLLAACAPEQTPPPELADMSDEEYQAWAESQAVNSREICDKIQGVGAPHELKAWMGGTMDEFGDVRHFTQFDRAIYTSSADGEKIVNWVTCTHLREIPPDLRAELEQGSNRFNDAKRESLLEDRGFFRRSLADYMRLEICRIDTEKMVQNCLSDGEASRPPDPDMPLNELNGQADDFSIGRDGFSCRPFELYAPDGRGDAHHRRYLDAGCQESFAKYAADVRGAMEQLAFRIVEPRRSGARGK